MESCCLSETLQGEGLYHESRIVSRKGKPPPTGGNVWGMCGVEEYVVLGGEVWFWQLCGSGWVYVVLLQKHSGADQRGLAFERRGQSPAMGVQRLCQ